MSSLEETVHLLRSKRNAERLLRTLERARRGEGKPMTVEELRRLVGLLPHAENEEEDEWPEREERG